MKKGGSILEEYEKRLNNLLMDTFRDISKMEESVLQNERCV